MKTETAPVTVGALGLIKKGMDLNLGRSLELLTSMSCKRSFSWEKTSVHLVKDPSSTKELARF